MMVRLALTVIPLLALAACRTESHEFCVTHPGVEGCPLGDGSGAAVACSNDTDCMTKDPDHPVCDRAMSSGLCVMCTASNTLGCADTTPICTASNTCRACAADADCPGSVCLPTGACAAASAVLHVASSGTGAAPCTASAPCSIEGALAAVNATLNVIKLEDAGPFDVQTHNIGANLTIDARPGATLMTTSSGNPIFSIAGNKSLTILDGIITSATGVGGDGIKCGDSTVNVHGTTIKSNAESAIDANNCTITVLDAKLQDNSLSGAFNAGINASTGSLTVARSYITGNFGGGISVANAKFVVVGNIVMKNGTAGQSTIGGLGIMSGQAGSRLEFNSIVENKSQASLVAGVQCTADPSFTGQNNLIWNNNSQVTNNLGMPNNGIEVGGCPHAHSDIGPAGTPGATNINTDPLFVSETADAHLTSTSPVRGMATVTPPLDPLSATDIDHQPRVAPYDLGADQYAP